MKLIERKPVIPGVESFIFEPAEPLAWKPGQFLHWVLHHEPTDERGSDRWFTVSSAPYEGQVMLTTRFLEDGVDGKQSSFKKALKKLEVGSEMMEVSDVDGDFTIEDPSGEYVFIAGGIGATPFRAIVRELDHDGAEVKATLLYGNRDENASFREEFDEIASRHPAFTVAYLSGMPIDEAAIRANVPDLAKPTFYVSGPEPMVESLMNVLKGIGVPENHLKGDWFPGYSAE